MRTLLKNLGRGPAIGLLALSWAGAGYGATIYQVGLPTTNVNIGGSSRSNIDWLNCGTLDCSAGGGTGGAAASATGGINGDAFSVSSSYLITSVTVYAVDNLTANNCTSGACAAAAATAFQNEFNTISLYFGSLEDANNPSGNTPPNCSSFNSGIGNCSFPAVATNPTIAQVGYTSAGACAANSGYLAADGTTCENIYSVTFSGLNINIGPGSYEFSVDAGVVVTAGCAGTTQHPNLCGWYNLASNNPAGNTILPGSIWSWAGGDLTGGSVSQVTGTNMDALISGDLLSAPEPGSLVLSGLGIVFVGLVALRRRKVSLTNLS